MRPVIALLLGLTLSATLAGCDRQLTTAPQGEPEMDLAAAEAAAANAVAPKANYPTGRLDRSHRGTRAPDMVFEDPQGRPARLSDFRGRPLLVNLWATWCGPCVVEMPSLDALAEREGDRLTVLALSQDMTGRQKVSEFFAARSFTRLQPYLDQELGVMTSLSIDTLPTTILYDAQGIEVWRMTGMADWEDERTARLLAEAERS